MTTSGRKMTFVVGSDHAGRILQDAVVDVLHSAGHVADVLTAGPPEEGVEYPEIARAVGAAIKGGRADRGVLICGSGAGMTVAANKLHGIRACVAHDTYTAHQMVEHDDVNVLVLGGRVVGVALASEITRAFAAAVFSGEERHVRRTAKVAELERLGE